MYIVCLCVALTNITRRFQIFHINKYDDEDEDDDDKKTATTTQENKLNKDEGATPQKMEAKPSGCACVYSVRLERMRGDASNKQTCCGKESVYKIYIIQY